VSACGQGLRGHLTCQLWEHKQTPLLAINRSLVILLLSGHCTSTSRFELTKLLILP
jgi:hypothetical protein